MQIHNEKKPDVLAFIANIAGVASLVLAVASGNLDKLSELQRWGLAGASAVMLWAFLMGGLIRYSHSEARSGRNPMACAVMLFGGLVAAGLLLAVLPFFAFGLSIPKQEAISLWAAGSFAAVSTLGAVAIFGFTI